MSCAMSARKEQRSRGSGQQHNDRRVTGERLMTKRTSPDLIRALCHWFEHPEDKDKKSLATKSNAGLELSCLLSTTRRIIRWRSLSASVPLATIRLLVAVSVGKRL